MVKDTLIQTVEGGPPPNDDSWWSSLLDDVERELVPQSSVPQDSRPVRESTPGVDWGVVQHIYEQDETVELKVNGYNRGGLLVAGDTMHGFVPVSHLVEVSGEKTAQERDHLLADYVDQTLVLKVIECDPERGRVVFSERAALSEPGSRNQLLDGLKSGDHVVGTVTNITDFGVFVDLGGLEGLIHVSEISWGRVRHPSDSLKLGQEITVYVISVDDERSRVALSLKRMHDNPWETAESRFAPGQLVEATITSILPYGAFARVEDGLDGLIHISEMCAESEALKPEEVVYEGEHVRVRILQVDSGRQRMGLSLLLEESA